MFYILLVKIDGVELAQRLERYGSVADACIIFYCWIDVNFHLGDLFLQTDDLIDSSGVLEPWTIQGAFKKAAPCVWVVDGGWLISPKAFFPQNGHGAFWNDAFQFLSDVRCLIFLLQHSNQLETSYISQRGEDLGQKHICRRWAGCRFLTVSLCTALLYSQSDSYEKKNFFRGLFFNVCSVNRSLPPTDPWQGHHSHLNKSN